MVLESICFEHNSDFVIFVYPIELRNIIISTLFQVPLRYKVGQLYSSNSIMRHGHLGILILINALLLLRRLQPQPARQRLLRHPHNSRDTLSFRKHHLQLLQTAAHGFRVAEVDDGENDC